MTTMSTMGYIEIVLNGKTFYMPATWKDEWIDSKALCDALATICSSAVILWRVDISAYQECPVIIAEGLVTLPASPGTFTPIGTTIYWRAHVAKVNMQLLSRDNMAEYVRAAWCAYLLTRGE